MSERAGQVYGGNAGLAFELAHAGESVKNRQGAREAFALT